MSKQKQKGYRLEKMVADYFGGQRRGTLGREDVNHPVLSIECKVKNPIPQSVIKDYAQATRNAPQGKIPIVVWKADGDKVERAFVILEAVDLHTLLCGLE